jgi:Superfamily I DNA and RNA helicases
MGQSSENMVYGKNMISIYAKKYFLTISNEVIKSNNINAAIPSLNLKGKSSIMKPEFANDLKIYLEYPDERREQFRKIKLNPIQERLATTRTEKGLRRIKGAAGSGKSQVLISRACNLSLEGKRVLILSFNITLYQYLFSLIMRTDLIKNNFSELIKNIEILHYHEWAAEDVYMPLTRNRKSEIWAEAQEKVSEGKTKDKFEAFDQVILSLLQDKPLKLYDAILIDEGQDWDLDKWNVVRKTIKDNGEIILVADQTQDIYGK